MKRRLLLSFAIGGMMFASLMALGTTAVHAGCNGPNDPNPCPDTGGPSTGDQEKKHKKPTPLPPTDTPVPTDTPQACVERLWYRDVDADTYGLPGASLSACEAPAGYGPLVADCNDASPAIHPGATDICGDGIDQDCSGADAACPVPPPGGGEGPGPAGSGPWLFGGGGVLLGILIGLLLPFKLGSFFDRVGKGTPGGGDSDPAGSFFDNTVGKGTPGGGDTNPAGSFFDSQPGGGTNPVGFDTDMLNPAPAAREAALKAREAALNVREAALKAREAANAPGSPTTGTDPGAIGLDPGVVGLDPGATGLDPGGLGLD